MYPQARVYGSSIVTPRPPVDQRPPLVFPQCFTCPSPTAFDQDMGAIWPGGRPPQHRDYLRASHWSRVVPGLPFVAGNVPWSGGSSEFPERLVQGLDYKYDRRWWETMTDVVLRAGDTHWLRWYGNARVDGRNSDEQFVDDCLYLKSRGLFVKVWLWAKDADPKDDSAANNIRRFTPIVEKMQKANCCDEYTPGGEWDLANVPGEPTITFWKWVGARAHEVGATCWGHLSSERTSWFEDGDPRTRWGFWDDLGDDCDGLDYQAMLVPFNVRPRPPHEWDIGEFQARLVNTLEQFGRQGNRHKLRAMEFSALLSFTQPHPNEDEHDALGFLAACTRDIGGGPRPNGRAVVWGSGDGWRGRDGGQL
jgi:hypothetical protein